VTQGRSGAGVRWLVIGIGAGAIVAQVLVAREALVVFEGNELSLGLTLAAWLFWTALGSALAGRLIARGKLRPGRSLRLALLAAGLFLPLTMVLVRLLRVILGGAPGESLGPGAFIYCFLALAPFCLAAGSLFPAVASLLGADDSASAGPATGKVYLLETVGSAIGGLGGAFLVSWMRPADATIWILLAAFAASLAPAFDERPRRWLTGARWLALVVLFAATACLLMFAGVGGRLEQKSAEILWKGYDIVTTRQSPYGRLTYATREGQSVVFHDGAALSSTADEQAAEESTHLPLLEHKAPRSALLIGGGSPRSLSHILEHPSIERLDYVEPDPVLVDLFHDYYAGWRAVSQDRRLRILETDARRFVRDGAGRYDVIIVSLPSPRTLQLNRFYTEEFFREARLRLAPGGVLSVEAPGAESYVSDELQGFLRCLRKSLNRVFPRVVAMPGDPIFFFASGNGSDVTLAPDLIVERLRARRIRAAYVREYYLPFRLMGERVADLERQSRPQDGTPTNRDLAPAGYYLDFVRWAARFSPSYGAWLDRVSRIPYAWLLVFCLALGVLGALLIRFRKRGTGVQGAAVASSVAAMGFTTMGLQVFLLLGFQAIHGFLYQQLALLIGAFMAGMALGSRLGLRLKRYAQWLPLVQLLLALWPPALYLAFRLTAAIDSEWLVAYFVFPALSIVSGGLGGCQFSLASRTYFPLAPRRPGRGFLYSLDLLGATPAAVLVSGFLLPVYGFARAAWLLALVNTVALGLLVVFRSGEREPRSV